MATMVMLASGQTYVAILTIAMAMLTTAVLGLPVGTYDAR